MTPAWAPDVRLRRRGANAFLVRGAESFALNATGTFIWQRCDGSQSLETIAQELVAECGVAYDTALADCREYVEELARLRLVEA